MSVLRRSVLVVDKSNEWHTVQGDIGIHACDIGLDSGAGVTVVAADLVHALALTGETRRISGVDKEVLLARLKLTVRPG